MSCRRHYHRRRRAAVADSATARERIERAQHRAARRQAVRARCVRRPLHVNHHEQTRERCRHARAPAAAIAAVGFHPSLATEAQHATDGANERSAQRLSRSAVRQRGDACDHVLERGTDASEVV
jgi:hypothetical protein